MNFMTKFVRQSLISKGKIMKKINSILFILFSTLLLLSCELFSSLQHNKPDSYYFNKVEPIQWKDSYILAATWFPPQIQVWDSETNKMIQRYSFDKKERDLWVYDMVQYNGVVWFIGEGNQRSLIRWEFETGELKYIQLDMVPVEVMLLPEYKNGGPAILTATYSDSRIGIAVRILDLDGNVLSKNDISFIKKNVYSIDCFYENGKYYGLASSDESYLNKNMNNILSVIKIDDETEKYVYDVDTDKFYGDFIGEAFGRELDNFECGVLTNIDGNNKFMVLSVSNKDFKDDKTYNGKGYIRFLYRINSLENFDVEYTGIYYDEEDAKSFWSVEEYDENIYITGRQLHIIPEKTYLNGLEVAIYSKEGGKTKKLAQMPLANQVYCEMKDDCAWFSKDVYSQDNKTFEWDYSDKTGIYKLDYKNQKVYEFKPDGTSRECEWIDCE